MQEIKKTKNSVKHYFNKKLHREDGPAVISHATEKWFINGKLHREDGPAIIDKKNSNRRYFIQGKELFPDSNEDFLCMKKGVIQNELGEHHFLNYALHREDGPAFIGPTGESWYIKGLLHREDGPANITKYTDYWLNEWYINGKLHRDNGPASLDSDGTEMWCQQGEFHREDGPAEITNNYKLWYIHGELHRLDGPAVEGEYLHQRKWHVDGVELNVHCTTEFVKHMKMRAFW